jgi:hypothetical protein
MYPQSTFHVPKPAAFIEINISLFTYLSQQQANFSGSTLDKKNTFREKRVLIQSNCLKAVTRC